MGLWPSKARAAVDAVQAVTATETWPSESSTNTTGGLFQVTMYDAYSSPVPRALALSVPGVLRGVTLIASTIAGLPLERVDANGRRVDLGWLAQPEAGRPRYLTTVDTITDLILDGRSFWLIRERDTTGAPRFGGCEYIDLTRIGDIRLANGGHTVTVDGKPVDPRDVIAFQGVHDGIRKHGARIIRTAIALEAAAKRYADTPLPAVTLYNDTGYDMDDTEIDAMLTAYKAARNAEGVAYSNVKPVTTAWDAMQLQLVEARQFTNTQLANLLGLPSQYIAGAATSSGGTVSYQNVTSDARSLIDFGLKEWMQAFESRLSMSDVQGSAWVNQVTPRGTQVRVVLDGLLRGNAQEMASVVKTLIEAGVMRPEEAAPLFDFIPKGTVPA